jgi:hypothetical protein
MVEGTSGGGFRDAGQVDMTFSASAPEAGAASGRAE